MKIFVARLSPYLPHLYTNAQHGFCPGRSCLTTVTMVLLCTNLATLAARPLYILALDLDKAYDCVHRPRLDYIMHHLGIVDAPFYRLAQRGPR